MDRHRRTWSHFSLVASLAAVWLTGTTSPAAHAAADGAPQCSRAIAAAKARIVATDTRALNRCALALLEPGRGRPPEATCRALHTSGGGLDRKDRTARRRIRERCTRTWPDWLPATCLGPGPQAGIPVTSADELAECVVRSAHCLAVRVISSTFGDVWPRISAQHSVNLLFEYSQVPGNSLHACLEAGPPATTTSTTLPTADTTTTLAPVDTTTTTVSLPAETTTTTNPQPAPTTTTLVASPPPRLVITEIMSNPDAQPDSAGEYFEVYNAGPEPLDLLGLTVSDLGSDGFSVQDSIVVAAGTFAVLGRTTSAGGGAVDYVYGSAMNLTNSADAIILTLDGNELDRVVYDAAFPLAAGVSMQLDPSATSEVANDDASAWCPSSTLLPDGDMGTPGSANAACGG